MKGREKKKQSGRPTLWKNEYIHIVKRLCILGATDEEIADVLNVTKQTIYGWKKKFPAFNKAIKEGKILADADVATSLYKSAVGFYNKETKVFMVNNQPIKVEIDKYNPPNPTSAIFFLKNRQPKLWCDRKIIQNVDSNDQIEEIRRIVVYPDQNKRKDQETE